MTFFCNKGGPIAIQRAEIVGPVREMSSLDIDSRHRYIKGDLIVGDALPFRLAAVRAACVCNGVSPSAFAVQPNIYHSP